MPIPNFALSSNTRAVVVQVGSPSACLHIVECSMSSLARSAGVKYASGNAYVAAGTMTVLTKCSFCVYESMQPAILMPLSFTVAIVFCT